MPRFRSIALAQASGTSGFDARSGRFVDMLEAGILDATKVVRMALENAVSVAGVLLLTEATMTEIEDEGRTATRRPPSPSIEPHRVKRLGASNLAAAGEGGRRAPRGTRRERS
jgi:hypothetical protein